MSLPRLTTIKLNVNVIDRLFNTVNQLIASKNRMIAVTKNIEDTEVRDLLRELDKVLLGIYGEDIRLDRKAVEIMLDPLIHVIRNAVDHGIEPPQERKRLGKPEIGTIKIGAQEEGLYIKIIVEDDGRGIDEEKVKMKAIEKGLITPEEAKRLTWDDIVKILTTPGFSTKEISTNISGRGIGLDVVKKYLDELGGKLEIYSEKNKGTKIIMKILLTAAIVRALFLVFH